MKLNRFFIFVIVIILLALLSIYYPHLTGESISDSQNYERESAFVTRVIDGDTVKVNLNGNEETIRLLGINTPEKGKPYSKKATEFLMQIENHSVEVLRDKEDIDKYDRKLRYVFYENELLNAEILQEGLATSFMLDGLKYEKKLKSAENYARNNEIGLWIKSKERCALCIELIELNYTEEFFIISNNCNFDCNLSGWIVKDDANHFFKLSDLYPGEEKKYSSETKIWNDEGDRFFMRDKIGGLVVFYEYEGGNLNY